MKLLSINIVIETLCLIIAFFSLKGDCKAFWKICIAYLFIVVITELFARYTSQFLHQPNGWIHNILLFFEIGFLHYAFFTFINAYSYRAKYYILASLLLLLALYGAEIFYWNSKGFYSSTFNVLSVVAVVMTLSYYFLFSKHEEYVKLKHHPEFWFVSGILFFYFGGTVTNFLYMKIPLPITSTKTLRYLTYHVLIFLLYSLWSYSFYCRRKQLKSNQHAAKLS